MPETRTKQRETVFVRMTKWKGQWLGVILSLDHSSFEFALHLRKESVTSCLAPRVYLLDKLPEIVLIIFRVEKDQKQAGDGRKISELFLTMVDKAVPISLPHVSPR